MKSNSELAVSSANAELQVVNEVHDSRVRDLLDDVVEYSREHPGLIRNVRLREKTVCVLTPDDGSQAAIDAFGEHGSSQVQILKGICGSALAVIGKESTIDFNIAESEQ